MALLVLVVYLIPSIIYIFLSSQTAASVGSTPEEVLFFELIKGTIFVIFTSCLIFGVCWIALSTLNRKQIHAQKMREALLKSERHATAGLLAATVAHDARNEITVLKSNNQFLQRQGDLSDLFSEILDEQADALERLIDLTSRFSSLENSSSLEQVNVDISKIAADVIRTLRGHTRLQKCDISIMSEAEVLVNSYPALIHQILINLILNAADAVDGEGKIEIRLSLVEGGAILEVHDNGPGIDEDDHELIFDAFFTTKEKGTGLGLLSVKACAEAHQGSVEVLRSPLGGACLRVLLHDVLMTYENQTDSDSVTPRTMADAS